MKKKMPKSSDWLRSDRSSMTGMPNATNRIGVDRENRIIHGYVVAQAGAFKSGRGAFDQQSLQQIVDLMRSQHGDAGTKSRFTHPDMSSDGLGKYLGRARGARIDGNLVRADLHLDSSAFSAPEGNLGGYVMDLAHSDPDAISSSLVLRADRVSQTDAVTGAMLLDEDGEPLPDIWRPTHIHASDIVDEGDAVDGLLSAGVDVEHLPGSILWQASAMLDSLFDDSSREAVEARLGGWLERYLTRRFGKSREHRSIADEERQIAIRASKWVDEARDRLAALCERSTAER